MGISATGLTVWTKGNVAKILITVGIVFVLFTYFYAPPLVPALRNSAIERCNIDQGGNYRDYKLVWRSLSFTDMALPPHWECTNKQKPDEPALDYGWYAGLTF